MAALVTLGSSSYHVSPHLASHLPPPSSLLPSPNLHLTSASTQSTVAEVKAVCAALSPTPRPLFLGVTVRDDGSNTLRSGEPLEAALDVAKGQSFVRGLLVNCCSAAAVSAALGPLKSAAEAIAEATGERVRFGGMANAFAVPTDVWLAGGGQGEGGADFDGGVMTAEAYGRRVAEWVQAGATLVGGCCGTTPAHIAEARKAVDAAGK